MKRIVLYAALTAGAAFGQNSGGEHPTGTRITPPTVNSVSPRGMSRGTTVELTVEGLNLAKASEIHFDQPGIKGKILRVKELPDASDVRLGSNGTLSTIDLGPLPPRNQVTVEVDVSPDAEIGPVTFRLRTPLGTSPEGTFLVEPYYGESADREPNNSIEQAVETYLPAVLVGEISRPGDVDFFKIKAAAGEQLVFENGGQLIGSSLQPVVSILREDMSVVKEFGQDGPDTAMAFAHKFDQAGTYYVRVGDYLQSGRASHLYRLKAGNFPLAVSAFPLGLKKGSTSEVAVSGYGLGAGKLSLQGETKDEDDLLRVRPEGPDGRSFSEVKLAVGADPEVLASGTNRQPATAQALTLPVTVNGRISTPEKGTPTENYFRFHARKGQKLVFEVNARRLNSKLDSTIEVLNADGKPIEIATVRSVLETFTVLRDLESGSPAIRIASITALAPGDNLMIGTEIVRLESLPLGPDADIVLESFGGQRLNFFGTTSETHSIDKGLYKIQIHPPGTKFTPNGLPIVTLYARNDDGGPGFGKDSRLEFTAPADGDYLLKIRDVQGLGGDDYAYRLNVREPRPDFRLAVTPRNPNVPAGGTIPLTVTALRLDGFNGEIDVVLEDLPAGLKATAGKIATGQNTTTLLLTADTSATLDTAAPLKLLGKSQVGGQVVAHHANPEDRLKLIALMPKSDIQMTAETREVVLEAGGTADVLVSILRNNGFGGRVPVEVRNLPPRIRVLDVGLNGVLLNEDENKRSFTLEADPTAKPIEQMIYLSGRIETRSPLMNSYAAVQPILLKVLPKGSRQQISRTEPPSASKAGAPK